MKVVERIRSSKQEKLIVQFAENSLAYALPVFFQQFIVFPLMGKRLGSEEYGHFLTVIALNYFMVNITASVLVNVRLLKKNEYEKYNCVGDFNLFMIIFAIIDTVVVMAGTIFYAKGVIPITEIVLSVIVVLLFLYHDYIVVQYRIEFKFYNILINNLILCVGYMAGLGVIFFFSPQWQFVFIIPYALSSIYDFYHTDYIKEPLRTTHLIKDTAKQYFVLVASSLLGSFVTYGDRLILYPLMDGKVVSVFTSAKLIGKLLSLISTPLSTFVLAYLVRNEKINIKIKWWYLVSGAGVFALLYVFCIIISKPLITFLYPEWASESLQYIPYTVAGGVIGLLNAIMNVFILRYMNSKWQIIKGAMYLVIYLVGGFSMLKFWGLMGLCISSIVASVCDTILMTVLLTCKYRYDKSKYKYKTM